MGRQNAANLDQRDLRVHVPNLRRARPIDKPLPTTAGFACEFSGKNPPAGSLPAWREALRAQGKPLAATNGCFDILHAGHVNYLQAARNEAAALIVV